MPDTLASTVSLSSSCPTASRSRTSASTKSTANTTPATPAARGVVRPRCTAVLYVGCRAGRQFGGGHRSSSMSPGVPGLDAGDGVPPRTPPRWTGRRGCAPGRCRPAPSSSVMPVRSSWPAMRSPTPASSSAPPPSWSCSAQLRNRPMTLLPSSPRPRRRTTSTASSRAARLGQPRVDRVGVRVEHAAVDVDDGDLVVRQTLRRVLLHVASLAGGHQPADPDVQRGRSRCAGWSTRRRRPAPRTGGARTG